MSARSPNRMLLSHPSTPPATVRIAIRRHPRMILFLAVASVRPNSLLSLCLIYISTLPANAVLVKKPPIKCLQTCQFNHDRSEGQAQASSSAAPARIPIVCIMRAFQQHARNHSIRLPHCIRECSGIRIFGMRIKSIAFTTDVAIIKNINADAVIAVYPFTPQPTISQAIIGISDVPVFVGVGGGITGGDRAVRLAIEAENQGAFGVVVNAPISDEVISRIKQVVDIPVIATIVSDRMDIRSRMEAGADFLNVSGATATPQIVRSIRAQFPDVPLLATGGPKEKTILETIRAGANAITYSPPSNGELFADIMQKYRGKL